MAEISDEKREQMNQLYFAAVKFRRAQLAYCDHVSANTTRDMMARGEDMHRVLVQINGGKDPVHFMSLYDALYETSQMLLEGSR